MLWKRTRSPASLALALIALTSGGHARAEVDAQNFLLAVDEHQPSARAYIMGISTGVASANLAARHVTGRYLYCVPPNTDLSPEQYIAVLQVYLRRVPEDANLPVSQAVMNGMMRVYPCEVN